MPIPDSINLNSLVNYLENEEVVEVEELLALYRDEDNEKYLVKWKGWPLNNATFEPKENVEHLLDMYPNIPDATEVGIERTEVLIKIYKIPMYFKKALENALLENPLGVRYGFSSESGLIRNLFKLHDPY